MFNHGVRGKFVVTFDVRANVGPKLTHSLMLEKLGFTIRDLIWPKVRHVSLVSGDQGNLSKLKYLKTRLLFIIKEGFNPASFNQNTYLSLESTFYFHFSTGFGST